MCGDITRPCSQFCSAPFKRINHSAVFHTVSRSITMSLTTQITLLGPWATQASTVKLPLLLQNH